MVNNIKLENNLNFRSLKYLKLQSGDFLKIEKKDYSTFEPYETLYEGGKITKKAMNVFFELF